MFLRSGHRNRLNLAHQAEKRPRRTHNTRTDARRAEQPWRSGDSPFQFVQQGLSASGGGLHLSLDQVLQFRLFWRRQRRIRVASRAPARHQILQPLLLCRGEESIRPQILYNDQRARLFLPQLGCQYIERFAGCPSDRLD